MSGAHRLACAALLAALLPAEAMAHGPGAALTPASVSHFPDDVALTVGNTRVSPDCRLVWSTADASDHHTDLACASGTSPAPDVVISWDPSKDWGQTNAGGLRIQSQDENSPTEWLRLLHDGTDATIQVGSGRLRLRGGGAIVDVDDTDGDFMWSLQGVTNDYSQLWMASGGTIGAVLTVDDSFAQVMWAMRDAGGGRQFIFGDYAYRNRDHGYASTVDGRVYVQSGADPTAAGANESVFLTYVAADDAGYVGTMKGPLHLSPAATGLRLPQTMATVPTEPTSCTSQGGAGMITYVDDTNDGGAGYLCACIATGDDGAGTPNAWDWRRVDDHATACASF